MDAVHGWSSPREATPLVERRVLNARSTDPKGLWTLMSSVALWLGFWQPAANAAAAAQSIEIAGKQRWAREIQIPGGLTTLITVRELGADVELVCELDTPAPQRWRVDSPIGRGGLLSVLLRPSNPSRLRIIIDGQEPAGYRARVELSVETLAAATTRAAETSVAAWSSFMDAGRAYASLLALRRSDSQRHDNRATGAALDESVGAYAAAMRQARQAKNGSLLAQASFHLAWITYTDLNEWDAALGRSQAAVEAMQAAGDDRGATRAISLNASALREVAGSRKKPAGGAADSPLDANQLYAQAIRQFESVARYHADRGQTFEHAQAINNIGLTLHYQGQYDQAARYYDDAARAFATIRDRPNEARSLQNEALVRYELGDLSGCATGYSAALALMNRDDDLQLYGDILNNAALCHYVQGEFDQALDQYNEAYRIQTQLDNNVELARTLHGLGSTYYSMGDFQAALDMYSQALPLRPANKDARGRAATLSAMGNLICASGRVPEATALYEESLSFAVGAILARIRLLLARCLTNAGRAQQAVPYLDEVAKSVASEDLAASILALERGRVLAGAREWSKARAVLESAFVSLGRFELIEDQSDALALLASAAVAQGDYERAMLVADRGIKLAEQARGRSRNPELRATLFAPWRRFYDLKIQLLSHTTQGTPANEQLRSNRQMLALQVAEQSRYRVMEESLTSASPLADPALTATLTEHAQVLADLGSKRAQLASRAERVGLDDSRTRHLQRDISALRARLDALNIHQTRLQPMRTAQLDGRTFSATIPLDTAIITYWIGEEHAYAWVLTRAGVDAFELAHPDEITAASIRLHDALERSSTPEPETTAALRATSRLVLAPLSAYLTKKRWIIVADGPLHYVPFGALPVLRPQQPAIATHDIALAPAVRFLAPRKMPARKITTALLVADPVYERTDERLAAARSSLPAASSIAPIRARLAAFQRLRGSGKELDRVASRLTATTIRRLTGFDASREHFLDALASPFDLIHIATHSRVDTAVPQLSAIVLSQFDEHAQERDPWIYSTDLRNVNVRGSVVVLSACESALGRRIDGEGLIGLSYELLAAGAQSVVASAWQVPDAPAVEYMDALYASMQTNGDVSAAVANAARALLRSPTWSHPRYWSSFAAYEDDL